MSADGAPDPQGPALSRFQEAGLLAAVLVFGGLAGAIVASGLLPVLGLFRETGLPVPAVVEVVLALGLPSCPLPLAILGAVAVLGAARLAPRATFPVAIGALVVVAVVDFACLAVHIEALGASRRFLEPESELPEPGRSAEIADAALAAVRRGIARKTTFRLPTGASRSFFIYDGPGAPATEPGDYDRVMGSEACVLLPWGRAGNASSSAEIVIHAPRPPRVDPMPAALAGREPPRLGEEFVPTVDGTLAPCFERVYSAGGEYSYALELERLKVDTNQDGRLGPEDEFVGDAIGVRVHVFRRFDPKAAAAPLLPRTNVPIATYFTVVRP